MKVNNSDSSSGYTNAAYSSKGIAGLASGIDTESVVQAMLMNEQNKIDKQTQQQQILEWKQDAYRDVITKINDFQDKYFNLTSDSCIRLTSAFSSMSTESSSKAVSVKPSSSAVDGNFTMQVAQLATNASVKSGKASRVEMKAADTAKANDFTYKRTVDIKIGENDAVTVDLKDVTDLNSVVSTINGSGLGNVASITDSITVKDKNGKAVTYELYDTEGNKYEGDVRITLSDDGKPTFKTAGGDDLDFKYLDSKGNEITDAEDIEDLQFAEEVTKGLRINGGEESIEISGSSAGLAILGYSGTVKTADGTYEIINKSVNTEVAAHGKASGKVEFTLDGITKSFDITEDSEGINSLDKLAQKVTAAFGSAIEYNGETKSFSVKGQGRQLTISAKADTMEAMGFGADTASISSQMRRSDTLKSHGVNGSGTFSINGADIEYDETDTISSLMNKINKSDAGVKMTFNDLSASFKIEANNSGTGFSIDLSGGNEVFSALNFEINGEGKFTKFTEGQNAIVNIDGTTVERSSNKINYNGQLIDLNATTGNYIKKDDGTFEEDENGNFKVAPGGTEQKAEITSSRDVDKVYDKLKAFVDDYNTLIEDLNKLTHEDANYKKYPPLTEAQKKEMTENEIKLWEEKSKQGLLRNDSEINSFLSDMRSAMYTKGDSSFILSNFGIDSSSDWKDRGKLVIDEDKLKDALKNNADEVTKFFTSEKGLAARLNDICKKTANTSSGSRGLLVIKAGVKGKATEKDNEIYDQLQQIKEKLEKLNKKYETKKERLWKQFNAMETALSKANSQSDYFANYM